MREKEMDQSYGSSDRYMSIYASITNRMYNRWGQGVWLHSVSNDHIEDSAEIFIALFLYNLLIYTFLRKVSMVSTKSRLWLDTRKLVNNVYIHTIPALAGMLGTQQPFATNESSYQWVYKAGFYKHSVVMGG